MEVLKGCPACNSTATVSFLACKDYTVSGESFQLKRCKACTLIYTDPRPDAVAIWPYYKSETYVSHSDEAAPGLINRIYREVRKITLGNKAGLVAKYARGRKLMDIGAGTGAFAAHMQQFGWEVMAIEPDADARQLAAERGLKTGDESDLLQHTEVDVLTMWHVLEHVHELQERVATLYRLLKPGGIAVIAVPNPESDDARRYGPYWAAYDVPRHLYHFTPKSIRQLFEKQGFKSENTHWMPFDPFYIALLSEQYKAGKPQLLRGAWFGFVSWLNSLLQKDSCSSQIYIFRKA